MKTFAVITRNEKMNCVFLVLYLGAKDAVAHTECSPDGLAVPSAPLDIFCNGLE